MPASSSAPCHVAGDARLGGALVSGSCQFTAQAVKMVIFLHPSIEYQSRLSMHIPTELVCIFSALL